MRQCAQTMALVSERKTVLLTRVFHRTRGPEDGLINTDTLKACFSTHPRQVLKRLPEQRAYPGMLFDEIVFS